MIWQYNIKTGEKKLLKTIPDSNKPSDSYQVINDKIITKLYVPNESKTEIIWQYNFYTWDDMYKPYLTLKVSNRPSIFFSKDLNFMYFVTTTGYSKANQLFVCNVSYNPNQPKNRAYEVSDYKKYATGYEPMSLWKIFKDNIAENRRNSGSSSTSDSSTSSNEPKKDECVEAESMDIPLENLRRKSKKGTETESKITYITEIDGWNFGSYWYDKEDTDYYIDSGMNKHHYESLDDCLRALYIYKKAGGCITKKGRK